MQESASNPRTSTVADNVRAEATRKNLSNQEVGAALGLSEAATSRRMRGHVEFSASELQQVAGLLGVPVSTLYGEVPA